jgi:hypothetical protein
MKPWRCALILASLCLVPTSCTRLTHVVKQMTWECAPDEYKSGYYARPDEYVRFRFVENPRCLEVDSARNFCASLQKAGRPIVNVEFEVRSDWSGVRGWRMLAVDGRPLQDVGGWGHAGSQDYSGRCPMDDALKNK